MLKTTSVLFHTFIISLFLFCLCGCSVNRSTCTLLTKSHKQCLEQEKIHLSNVFDAYRIAKNKNNIGQTIDSVVMSFSNRNDRDTIYMIEECNPPLYSYNAVIWNSRNAITIFGSGSISSKLEDDDRRLIGIVEEFDRLRILQKSHEQPLSYSGEWEETRIASRIIMERGKSVHVESILFKAIDVNSNNVPILIE